MGCCGIGAMLMTVVFAGGVMALAVFASCRIDQLMPIAAEGREISFGVKRLENQQRSFLTGSVMEHAVTKRKIASYFMVLYIQETIEWE
jgi:hypothetical protein